VLDGGLASELEAAGFDLANALWSARALIEAPETVAAVHRNYLEAGADVIETATYQATLPTFTARGLASAVALALTERDRFWSLESAKGDRIRPLVAASIGSYGAILADGSEYRGDYGLDMRSLADWHRPRVRILEESGADLLAFETIPSFVEAHAIAALMDERGGTAAWVSFQVRDTKHLADGTPVAEAVSIVERCERIVAVGVNCVAPSLVTPLLAQCRTATAKPLVAYPNRGGTWEARTKRWTGDDAIAMGPLAREWREAGAALIGGCCRTTPADIRTISLAL